MHKEYKKYIPHAAIACVIAIVLLYNHLIEKQPQPLTSEEAAVAACEMRAFEEYNRLSLMLGSKALDAIATMKSHIPQIIAQRRLEESYCRKVAACEFLDKNKQHNASMFAITFDDCLKEEAKERVLHED